MSEGLSLSGKVWSHLPHLAPLLLCCSTLTSLPRDPIPTCSPISLTHCSHTRSHCATFSTSAAALEWMVLLTPCSMLSAVEGMLSHWQPSWKCLCRATGPHACLMDACHPGVPSQPPFQVLHLDVRHTTKQQRQICNVEIHYALFTCVTISFTN